MSLKRECDRCHHLTPVDSLNGRDFREVQISRGSVGGATPIYKGYDLCKDCVLALERWLKTAPAVSK